MAGVKGRSGRKSKRDEQKRLDVIEKAWDLVSDMLCSNDKNRHQVARDIVLRDITTKIEGKGIGNDTTVYNIIREIREAQALDKTPVELDSRHGLHDGRTRLGTSDKEVPEQGTPEKDM